MDQNLQRLVSLYASGHPKTHDLIKAGFQTTQKHLAKELSATQRSITQQVADQLRGAHSEMAQASHESNLQAISRAQRHQFLQSLKFPDMNERRNQWIFAPCDISARPSNASHSTMEAIHQSPLWHDFGNWLKSDSSLYWISGKPGSGKSTLVRYILSNKLTQTTLNGWRQDTIILSHFFWKPGSQMQRNIKGLLCSLLYQVVSLEPALPASILAAGSDSTKDTNTDWSVPELRQMLMGVLKHFPGVCIFLDGLDEVCEKDGPIELMKLIDALRAITAVKLCLASRPETHFRNRLHTEKHLKLEDFTAGDMRLYAQKKLDSHFEHHHISPNIQKRVLDLLIDKAEGVFLWLYLSVRSLIYGVENDDDGDLLLRRLDLLPTELAELYKDMWHRLNKDSPLYRQSSAAYFNLAISARELGDFTTKTEFELSRASSQAEGPTLFQLAAAADPTIRQCLYEAQDKWDLCAIERACARTRKEIQVRCVGLLEECEDKGGRPHRYQLDEKCFIYFSRRVRFMHRTAYDFLVEDDDGRQIRSYDSSSKNQQFLQLINGHLMSIRVLAPAKSTHQFIETSVDKILIPLTLARGTRLAEPESYSQKFEILRTCWEWYDCGYLVCIDQRGYPYRYHPHFLAAAAQLAVRDESLKDFVLESIRESEDPKALSTIVLRQLFQVPIVTSSFALATTFLEPLIALGADPHLGDISITTDPEITFERIAPLPTTAFTLFLVHALQNCLDRTFEGPLFEGFREGMDLEARVQFSISLGPKCPRILESAWRITCDLYDDLLRLPLTKADMPGLDMFVFLDASVGWILEVLLVSLTKHHCSGPPPKEVTPWLHDLENCRHPSSARSIFILVEDAIPSLQAIYRQLDDHATTKLLSLLKRRLAGDKCLQRDVVMAGKRILEDAIDWLGFVTARAFCAVSFTARPARKTRNWIHSAPAN